MKTTAKETYKENSSQFKSDSKSLEVNDSEVKLQETKNASINLLSDYNNYYTYYPMIFTKREDKLVE